MNEGAERSELEQNDTVWVKAFQAGERSAFDKLVLRHQDRVFSVCFRLLGDRAEADDCAQESFVKAYRSLNRFRLAAAFSTWLYRIAVNTCRNRLASSEYRRGRRMARLDEPRDSPEGTFPMEIGDESLSPERAAERREREALIQRAIDSLPAAARDMVVLRDIEGLSYEEIAEITHLRLGTVKSKLARARRELREKLRGLI